MVNHHLWKCSDVRVSSKHCGKNVRWHLQVACVVRLKVENKRDSIYTDIKEHYRINFWGRSGKSDTSRKVRSIKLDFRLSLKELKENGGPWQQHVLSATVV